MAKESASIKIITHDAWTQEWKLPSGGGRHEEVVMKVRSYVRREPTCTAVYVYSSICVYVYPVVLLRVTAMSLR